MARRLVLGKDEFCLHYSINSMCALEEAAKVPLEEIFSRRFSAVRLLMWAGIMEKQPGIGLLKCGEMLDEYIKNGGTLEEIVEICSLAMQDAGFIGRMA